MLWGSVAVAVPAYGWHLLFPGDPHMANDAASGQPVTVFTAGVFELINQMWWGLALGILFVGLMDRVPRDIVMRALGGRRPITGILKATLAGVLFDLCSHGILMIGMKLYERGATIGQTMAFLLASPWNSLSLTIILAALIGWKLTLLFILLSALIGIATGVIADRLVAAGVLPDNPNRQQAGEPETSLMVAVRQWLAALQPSPAGALGVLRDGLGGSRMVLRWLLFGVVLASLIRATVPAEVFASWFGPGLLGLLATTLVATVVEVCSEGSAPLAADIITRAAAPGNGFTFLMAGVSTDYTEIMSLKDTTGSWKLALALPLISLPQTLLVAALVNHFY